MIYIYVELYYGLDKLVWSRSRRSSPWCVALLYTYSYVVTTILKLCCACALFMCLCFLFFLDIPMHNRDAEGSGGGALEELSNRREPTTLHKIMGFECCLRMAEFFNILAACDGERNRKWAQKSWTDYSDIISGTRGLIWQWQKMLCVKFNFPQERSCDTFC